MGPEVWLPRGVSLSGAQAGWWVPLSVRLLGLGCVFGWLCVIGICACSLEIVWGGECVGCASFVLLLLCCHVVTELLLLAGERFRD